MYRNLFVLICIVVAGLNGNAQVQGYTKIVDYASFKTQFALAANKTTTIRSDFTQEKNMSMLSEKIISKGKFFFKKQDKVRMEYLTPFSYLMIINGSKVYIKDGQKENTISTNSNKIFRQVSQIMLDCVSGSVLANPDFTIVVYENKSEYLIEMIPASKALKGFFKKILVFAGKTDYNVSKVEMIEMSGDNTILNFTNRELNSDIPDAVFTLH
ncbi:MAG: outer membrane lipoprotein carrier protein LolA [Bacteroidetes bacterium]|nr:outer membrane lipoprotein carrier protein LolA [Bacteroidota bacterium]MBP6401681.1 outer membrane lipoprotein carrier protein LolA [Bacteroidia bacterium]MBK6839879.1 outer membrane lipoprotein carrier protein LolA [Bacteroidota bacterium]MBK9525183.1 outer membrane lipoprotein carrier protein LolA [Bacteroidota bacterium]MBK9543354.1 outer membrane lipoprotein carrier protein LolA [Bacteroidota bacterium]